MKIKNIIHYLRNSQHLNNEKLNSFLSEYQNNQREFEKNNFTHLNNSNAD